MVTCENFYERWETERNFCHKSEITAKEIDRYIRYRERYKLESYEINRCALFPFMQIENSKVVHIEALKELKRRCKKLGGRNVTRRLSIEIINSINERIDIQYRIKSIPSVRTRMDGYQHEIGNVSFDVRNSFDTLKNNAGIVGNNELMMAMISYCSRNTSALSEIKQMIESSKKSEESDSVRIVSEV